jgi:hypothetical protein
MAGTESKKKRRMLSAFFCLYVVWNCGAIVIQMRVKKGRKWAGVKETDYVRRSPACMPGKKIGTKSPMDSVCEN